MHMRRRAGEEHRRLSGGIAAADDDHLLIAAERRLHRGRRVMDALPLEPRVVRQVELPVACPGRHDHRPRRDRTPVLQQHAMGFHVADETGGGAGNGQVHAEFLRLGLRPPGQRRARDAGREARVVLDLRRGPRLSARCDLLDHDGGEALGSGIDRGREPGRPAPDHGQEARQNHPPSASRLVRPCRQRCPRSARASPRSSRSGGRAGLARVACGAGRDASAARGRRHRPGPAERGGSAPARYRR